MIETSCRRIRDDLPFYLNGTLAMAAATRVDEHLAGCAECRAELAFWRSLSIAVEESALAEAAEEAAAAPSVTTGRTRPRTIASSRPASALRAAVVLLAAQRGLVHPGVWLASLLIVTVGFLLHWLLPTQPAGALLLRAFAPVVTACGVAALYAGRSDPAYELLATTSTSPQVLLMARMAVMFGFNAVVIGVPGVLIGTASGIVIDVVGGWLAPMALLATLALWIALLTNPSIAAAASLAAWLAALAIQGDVGPWAAPPFQAIASMLQGILSGPWIWLLVAAQLGVALWLAGRHERLLKVEAA